MWERNERAEVADIAEALGLDYALTVRVVDELRKDGQLTGVEVAQDPYLLRIEPTAKARRELGQWPTRGDELYDRFIAVLAERIAAEPDEAKRTRLEELLGVADDVGHQRAGSPSSRLSSGARASGLWSMRQRDRRMRHARTDGAAQRRGSDGCASRARLAGGLPRADARRLPRRPDG